MSDEAVLVLSGDADGEDLHVEAAPGTWTTVRSRAADAFVDAVAGVAAGVHVSVAGQALASRNAGQRRTAGLAVVASRLPPLPGLRVVDVIELGVAGHEVPLWQSLLGTSRARHGVHDDEAAARALAGRIGLGRWLGVDAEHLPPSVAAMTDLARGLVAAPRALVWRRPEWLAPSDIEALVEVVEEEQDRLGFAVVEIRQAPQTASPIAESPSPGPPAVDEISGSDQ